MDPVLAMSRIEHDFEFGNKKKIENQEHDILIMISKSYFDFPYQILNDFQIKSEFLGTLTYCVLQMRDVVVSVTC